jgi:hypothetical protein
MPWNTSNFIDPDPRQVPMTPSPSSELGGMIEELSFEEQRLLAFLKEMDPDLAADSLHVNLSTASKLTPTQHELNNSCEPARCDEQRHGSR